MKRLLIIAVMIIMTALPALSQTIHEANVEKITLTYWTLLGRAPDRDGMLFWTYDMDRQVKDEAGLREAFLVSVEYQTSQHPSRCIANYVTNAENFTRLRSLSPQESLTLTGQFTGRNLVGAELDPATGFFGNTITINDGQCEYILWYDFAALGSIDAATMLAKLPNSKKVQISYDPITGMARSLKILEFQ